MHKWAWVMAISLNYCSPLHLSLKFCNGFNRQKQENDKIKFWKSVPSYVLVSQYQCQQRRMTYYQLPLCRWHCHRCRRSWCLGRPSRHNHHKVQNGDLPRQDKSDDKQPKWLPKRDQDKRSEARRSGELQVPWSNHLQRRIKTRDSFQDSPDNSSSF